MQAFSQKYYNSVNGKKFKPLTTNTIIVRETSMTTVPLCSDYGYARADFNSPCVRDNITILPNPCGDGKTKTYTASTG